MPTLIGPYRDYVIEAPRRTQETVSVALGGYFLLADGASHLLLSDGTSALLLRSGAAESPILMAPHRDYVLEAEGIV